MSNPDDADRRALAHAFLDREPMGFEGPNAVALPYVASLVPRSGLRH